MKIEKEITVKVNCDYDTLIKDLKQKGFQMIERYQLNDVYMLPNSIDIDKTDDLEILKNCVLVRDIDGIDKQLVYKYKKYAENGNILEQGKVKCNINDIEEGINFLEAINYKVLFKIYDTSEVYTNGKTELVVQYVNDKYLFIELESEFQHTKGGYSSIQEMIDDLNSYDIDFDKNDYFAKKALIIFRESYRK